MDNIKQWIEDVVEKKNWIIQVIYLLIMITISVIFKFDIQTTDKIIVELLFVIAGELFVFGIKDSIMQKKVNRIDAKQDINLGRLFRVADFDLSPFFTEAKENMFVSGIALNGFFKNCKDSINDFLDNGKTIHLLISSPNLIIENAKLYFGKENEKEVIEYAKKIVRYQMDTLESIKQEYKKYFIDKKIEIRISNCVFSTSFVAYDFMVALSKNQRAIKASFYQYGCSQPEKEPNILLRTDDKREWYTFFENTMKKQWDNAKNVETMIALEELYAELQTLYDTYK